MKILAQDELRGFAKEVIGRVGQSGIVLLQGDLASGKTTFVKEFVKALGLHVEVNSPTFSIMNEYENRVCHYDIYQNGVEGFLQNGLLEKLEEPKYHLVEWADLKLEEILKSYGFEFLKIEIKNMKDKRGYICTHSK
jgi:tRNA threonylcarbamoyladenosine biosynthesis protein TsaE